MVILNGVLRRGERLVVPASLCKRILELAHEGHIGMRAMKRRIRENFWWQAVDKSVEGFVRDCMACLVSDKSQVTTPTLVSPVETNGIPWTKQLLIFLVHLTS